MSDQPSFGEYFDPTPEQFDQLRHWDRRFADLNLWLLRAHVWMWPTIRGTHAAFLHAHPDLRFTGIPLHVSFHPELSVTVTPALNLTDPDWVRQAEQHPHRFNAVIRRHPVWELFVERPRIIEIEAFF